MHKILLLFSHLVATTTTTTAAVPLLLLCSVDADEFPLRTHQTDKINEYNHFFDCNIQRRHVYTLHTAEYLIFVCVQINAWMDFEAESFYRRLFGTFCSVFKTEWYFFYGFTSYFSLHIRNLSYFLLNYESFLWQKNMKYVRSFESRPNACSSVLNIFLSRNISCLNL